MDAHSPREHLNQNVSDDEYWAHAVTEVENIVNSDEPLVATVDHGSPKKRRRSIAKPLGFSLFFASGIALAMALYPASPSGAGSIKDWQSAPK